ncbi:MAG: helix-turn-helix domain-containing protein [Christensenellales bacterium]
MRKGVLGTWLLSYALVLFLPIITAIISLSVSDSVIQKQTDTINEGMLALLNEAVDLRINKIVQDSMHVAANERVTRLVHEKGILDKYSAQSAYYLKESLKGVVTRNDSIRRVYLYVSESDLVMSDATLVRSELFFETEIGLEDMTHHQWLDLLTQKTQNEFVYIEDSAESCIWYICPLAGAGARSALVMQLKSDAIAHLISRISTGEGMLVTIYDPGGTKLAANYEGSLPEDTSLYIKSSIVSQETGFRYESLIPRDIYLEESKGIKLVGYSAIAVSFGVCIFIIAYAMRRNYSPLRALVYQLESNLQLNSLANESEYAFLRDSIDSVFANRQQERQLLQERTSKLQQAYLTRLMLGRAGMGIPAEEYLSLLQLDYSSGLFAVILFEPDPQGEGLRGELRPGDMRQFKLYGHSVEISGRIAFLAEIARLDEAVLNESVFCLHDQLSRRFSDLAVGVSSIHSSAMGISDAYEEALYCVEYALATGASQPVSYTQITMPESTVYYYPMEHERRFMGAISSGNSEAALNLMREIWAKNLQNSHGSQEHLRILLYDIISSLYKAIADQTSPQMIRQFPMQKLHNLESKNIDENYAFLEHAVSAVCEMILKEKKDEDIELKERIIAYINRRYFDPALSVEQICETFSKSRTKLFNLFKDSTGEGLLNQINVSRISASKHLLASSEMPIGQIAERVGYLNSNTFIRVFKRYEGITPGKYRDILSDHEHKVNGDDIEHIKKTISSISE